MVMWVSSLVLNNVQLFKNANLCRAIWIVIRILNPHPNPDHPQNSMPYRMIGDTSLVKV